MRWLLLHGTPLTPAIWEGVAERLDGEVTAPNLTAVSARVSGAAPLAVELAQEVCAAVRGDEIVVIGHSFGGQVALEVALAAPHRVRRVIILCSRHLPYPPFAETAQDLLGGLPVDVDAAIRRWFTAAEVDDDGPAVRMIRRMVAAAPRQAWAAALNSIAAYDGTTRVPRITVPVDLFAAGFDGISPPSVMAELAEALPDARLHVIDAWAHMSPFVDPGRLAARFETLS